ncbi:RNA polymerase sigma factor FliA [Deltaproteobacteria bacterium TL4]
MKPNPYAQQAKKDKREEMVLEHAPLIKRIVSHMAARFPPSIEKEELYQAGMLGLLDAVDKFEPSKDVQFKTYAEFRIRGAILDELRAMDWIPRSVRSAVSTLEEAHHQLTAKLQREPSDREVAKYLDMSLPEYHEFLAKARPLSIMSFEDFGGGEDAQDILEIIADPNVEDPFTKLTLSQSRLEVAQAIEKLAEQEQLILSLYYEEELNLKEIGEILGITESRVSQIRTKIILKLRSWLKTEE